MQYCYSVICIKASYIWTDETEHVQKMIYINMSLKSIIRDISPYHSSTIDKKEHFR